MIDYLSAAPPEPFAILDVLFKVLLAVGGVGGVTALFMVRAQKRKVVSETGKTDAEADSVLADASLKKTMRETAILDMYERGMANMQERLDEAEERIDRLTEYVEVLVTALRSAGSSVPPMPHRMVYDAHQGKAGRVEGEKS